MICESVQIFVYSPLDVFINMLLRSELNGKNFFNILSLIFRIIKVWRGCDKKVW